ncbi:RloB family protein [Actinokineospora sp. 24-640]
MIFCEGEASEPDYIKGLKQLPAIRRNTAIDIEIDPDQGMPLTLVKRAVERKRDDEVDECWCVFDVEWPQTHPNLSQAISLAKDHGIRLAMSNPCFELWLILHFEDQSACISTAEAESRSRKLEGRSGKRINAAAYMPKRAEASRRAQRLAVRHVGNGTACPNDNPSSGMSELIAAIEPADA